jgi:flagellar basal-body rod modification protein FlgD
MTTTSGVTTSSAVTSLATGSSSSSLNNVNFDTFLTLLTVQLKNQDPLNPMDGTEFTGQIAQFSQLEQQIKSNSYLETLNKQTDYSMQTLATSYLGKDVLVQGTEIAKSGSGTVQFGYSTDAATANVTVDIYNESTGAIVRSMVFDGGAAGSATVAWDGKDESGNEVADGSYKLKIKAVDTDGKTVNSSTYAFGTVTQVANDSGAVTLLLADGRTTAFDDVLIVK